MLKSGARVAVFFGVIAMTAVLTNAQQLPDAPAPMPMLLTHSTGRSLVSNRDEKPVRIVDRKFMAMGAALMALTVSDLERTQHCLARAACVELNPMLPHSRAGMYAVNVPINAGTMYLAYKMKAAGWKTWWVAPVLNIAGHAVGTGIRF